MKETFTVRSVCWEKRLTPRTVSETVVQGSLKKAQKIAVRMAEKAHSESPLPRIFFSGEVVCPDGKKLTYHALKRTWKHLAGDKRKRPPSERFPRASSVRRAPLPDVPSTEKTLLRAMFDDRGEVVALCGHGWFADTETAAAAIAEDPKAYYRPPDDGMFINKGRGFNYVEVHEDPDYAGPLLKVPNRNTVLSTCCGNDPEYRPVWCQAEGKHVHHKDSDLPCCQDEMNYPSFWKEKPSPLGV